MLKLLNVPISPFGAKVTMALCEKGIPFETREPDLEAAQAGRDPELTAETSPLLEIPLLVADDVTIFDSTVILEYLEDRWPEPPMLPPTPAERARVRMIEKICGTTYEAAVWGVYEVSVMGRVAGEAQQALLVRGAREIAGLNGWLERQLGARTWMNGARFGWGDCCAYPAVHFADRLGCVPPPALAAWLGRMRERESARRIDAEFAAWYETPLNRPMDTTGTWKRLYKSHRLEWLIRAGGLAIVADGIANETIRFSPEIR